MKYVAPARNPENTPVYIPLYNSDEKIVNVAPKTKSTSVLSLLETAPTYIDIEGRTVLMKVTIGDEVFEDTVEIYGTTSTGVVVKIGERFITVLKSAVKFYNL